MSAVFKYCPFCGGNIPPNALIKYCPFCGEKFVLDKNLHSNNDSPTIFKDEVKIDDIKTEIKQPKPIIEKYIAVNIDENHINQYKQKRIGKIIESERYSIILKNAPNKQNLARKLEKVLLRGSFAIRLAIDTVPSIIVYKAKSDDVIYLDEVFTAEEVSTSIVAGDFNNKPTIDKIFTQFVTLDVQTQKNIKQLPINLWIGDNVLEIFPKTYQENNEGITIISDNNIFFIPDNIGTTKETWFIRSHHLISNVIMEDECLQISYKNDLVTTISFLTKQKLTEAYQCLYNAFKI